jgi:hypothetical protein
MYKNQEACKELREGFRRSPPLMFWLDTNIIGPGDRWNQPARAYRFLLPRLGIITSRSMNLGAGRPETRIVSQVVHLLTGPTQRPSEGVFGVPAPVAHRRS